MDDFRNRPGIFFKLVDNNWGVYSRHSPVDQSLMALRSMDVVGRFDLFEKVEERKKIVSNH